MIGYLKKEPFLQDTENMAKSHHLLSDGRPVKRVAKLSCKNTSLSVSDDLSDIEKANIKRRVRLELRRINNEQYKKSKKPVKISEGVKKINTRSKALSAHAKVYRKEKAAAFKILISKYKDSGCSICGYNKCQDALHFHHKDPDQKDHPVSKLRGSPIEKVITEIDKCIVLCANCHAELHQKLKTKGKE